MSNDDRFLHVCCVARRRLSVSPSVLLGETLGPNVADNTAVVLATHNIISFRYRIGFFS